MSDTTTESSIRDTLSASMDVLEEEITPAEAPSAPVEQSYAPADDNVPPADGNAPSEPEKAAREYNRDEAGKFAAKEAEKAAKEAAKADKPRQEMTPGPKAGPSSDPTERAPQAWKPAAREHWAQIPKEAREEIIRHEQQVKQTLQQTAEIRRYADAVQKTLEPYRHFIKAEGSNDFQAIDNMMAAAAKLRTGTSTEIAQLVSQIVTQYGVGRFGNQFISTLDEILSGGVPSQQQTQEQMVQNLVNQQFSAYQQQQEAMRRQAYEQQLEQQSSAAVDQFLGTNPEFYNDVRFMMADLADLWDAQGVQYNLQQAYETACRAHPEVSKVLQQREQAKIAQSMTQTAQKARSAAVSVGGSPAVAAPEQPVGSIRDAIQFALHQNSR